MSVLPRPARVAQSLLLSLTAAPALALVGGFQIAEQNASGLGSAFAGQAALAEDASAIYYNPAQLARLSARRQLLIAVSSIRPRSTFSDRASCAPSIDPTGATVGGTACPFGGGGNLGHSHGGPGGTSTAGGTPLAAYAAWQLRPSWSVGLGVGAPFGLETQRDDGWVGRFHSIGSEVRAINLNPTLSWTGGAVSAGLGLNAQNFKADLRNAVSYRLVAVASQNPLLLAAVPQGSEGVAHVEGDDWGFGWNAGLGWQLGDVAIGVAYRSPVRYKIQGSVRFDARPAALNGVDVVADGKVRADVKLPDTLSLAVAWRGGGPWSLMADVTRTGWDSIQDLTVVRSDGNLAGRTLASTPFRFRNATRVGVGGIWQLNPEWSLRAGAAQIESPVTDTTRTAQLPDSKRRWLTLGAGWQPAACCRVDAGFAYVRSEDASIARPNQEAADSPARGSLVGSFRARTRIYGLQMTYSY